MSSRRLASAAAAAWLCVGALAAITPAAGAQDAVKTYDLGEALQICARVEDTAARLSCFEELARKAAPTIDVAPTSTATNTAPIAEPPVAREDPPASQDSAPRYVVMRAEDFEGEVSKAQKPAEQPRAVYEATVLRAWKYGNGEYHIALTNGEIWKSQASDTPRPVKDGEKVELHPGAVGGWFMQFKTLKRPTIRVTRVE